MANSLVLLYLMVVGALALPQIQPRINLQDKWRVVGGKEAVNGSHPYIISLRYNGSHNCGGSIVNKEWVITAAHCLQDSSPSSLTVVAGTNSLSASGITYKVLEIVSHEDYDSWNNQNDVGIVKVEPIVFTDVVKPIVAETEDVDGDQDVVLSGWGRTSYPGTTPDKLQELALKTTTVDYCKSRHKNLIFDSEICTLTVEGEGACFGDSGGPLTRTVDGVERLVGAVSWGNPCARGYPDVYSRISSFISWFNGKCENCLNS